MKAKKVDVAYSVQVIVKQIDDEKAFEIYDMFEICFNQANILESIGLFKENLQLFLETRIFTEK